MVGGGVDSYLATRKSCGLNGALFWLCLIDELECVSDPTEGYSIHGAYLVLTSPPRLGGIFIATSFGTRLFWRKFLHLRSVFCVKSFYEV
jgi:hypothetical protein